MYCTVRYFRDSCCKKIRLYPQTTDILTSTRSYVCPPPVFCVCEKKVRSRSVQSAQWAKITETVLCPSQQGLNFTVKSD